MGLALSGEKSAGRKPGISFSTRETKSQESSTLVAVVALYGLFSTPHALMSLHQLRAASALYDGGNFQGAAQAYEGVLKEAPRSGTAKLGAAKAYFQLHDESADKKALTLLVGMELDKYDAEDLAKVMPEKYRDLFTAGSRKGSVVLESVNGSNVDRPWFDAIYAVLVSMALPMILAGNI